MKRLILSGLMVSYSLVPTVAQPDYERVSHEWADSVLLTLSTEEKIGQLFMVAAYSNKDEKHYAGIERLIREEGIGGLIFMQGGPGRQIRLTNRYQSASKIPLMIAMDAEWGMGMRLDSLPFYPWAMTLGAVRDTQLIRFLGLEMGRQCRRMGVNISFSPVVDLNTNPKNPIINSRSFGELSGAVTASALALTGGLQQARVLACAKHFPGHGDTDQDSHKTLPQVTHTKERLERVELSPYPPLFKKGLGSVMVAHLDVPALDNSGVPASVSPKVIQGLLREKMGFYGLVFTDALNMKGVSERYDPGELELQAFLAGNDVLLFPEDVPKAKQALLKALDSGKIAPEQLNLRVRKILQAKYWMGLNRFEPIRTDSLMEDLETPYTAELRRKLFTRAQTLVVNRNRLLPVKEVEKKRFAVVTTGTRVSDEFLNTLRLYAPVDYIPYDSLYENEILLQLADYDLVFAAHYTDSRTPWKKYGFTPAEVRFLQRLELQNDYVLTLFGNPYSLLDLGGTSNARAVLVAYQNHPEAESAAAQVIFGGRAARGRLPVTAGELFQAGYGIPTNRLGRLSYGLPEEVGLDSKALNRIDDLVMEGIVEGAYPGAQVLIARKGVVVYHKAFGYHTYKRTRPVKTSDLYDLASITKITATVPSLMHLFDRGSFDLDKTLGDYLPGARFTNKEDLVIREVLAHQGRLQAWIPFYTATLNEGNYVPGIYSKIRSMRYSRQVADSLYADRFYRDSILNRIYASELIKKKEYKYSDLGYYLFKEIIENETRMPLNKFVQEKFYGPMGAYTLTYNPLDRFGRVHIAPTEQDGYFRKQLVHGYVHDQGAALLGGVGGHAGLFSNANDLAKMMQMYLNFGTYGGIRFLDSATVAEFTRCQYCEDDNRRGVGFDKPQLSGEGPTCGCVSMLSFGHTGFTGTMAWVDPEAEIVYIFLSNRVYPSAENTKLIKSGIRTRIQEILYESVMEQPLYKPLEP